MRHNVSGRKLGRSPAHRKMLYRNLVTALFKHERIQTTVPKAKEARRVAEKLITFAKRGDLHARRQAARKVNDPQVLQKLFDEIGPRYNERPGGYTRILRLHGFRKGDNAELAILELVDSTAKPKVSDSKKRQRARRILKLEEKAEAKAALSEAAEAVDAAADEKASDEEPVAADSDATVDPENPDTPEETGGQETEDQETEDEKTEDEKK